METTPTDTNSESEIEVKFSDLGLSEPVMRAVTDAGYEIPTDIQAQAIPLLLQGRDVTGASQTGTGKTAAFTLPTLVRLVEHKDAPPRCLVIEPTRELASQVYDAIEKYGKHLNLRTALLYGGVKYGKQCEQLDQYPDIIVATPGRLLDHISQGNLSLRNVEILILDEADRMLDMGFMPDVKRLVKQCKSEGRQSLLFSATAPPEIERLTKWMLKDPVHIAVGGGRSAAETVKHAIYPVEERQKFDLLLSFLQRTDYHSVIIFCRTKAGTDIIARWLGSHGHEDDIAVLHSDRNQKERENALKGFREGRYEILVATDIVARGIDISDVSHVINYDIPLHCEDYVHRIGRTGRARKEGDAVTLMTPTETEYLRSIERFIGMPIERAKLPDFEYRWSPVLETLLSKPKKKKRNRGFGAGMSGSRRKR